MPRKPLNHKQNKPKLLAEFLKNYDYKSLSGMLVAFENQSGWDLLQAFMHYKQKAFEVTSLDMAGMTGKSCEAAFTSGYAKACEDMADHFVLELRDTILGRDGVIENVRPEDNVEEVPESN